ncbi:hypothetical protein CHELA20_50392 [Hyphomicrobiales bacterium]|nr:hypothetical protein CHELA20_50392 [Hyphomicrobiales bacterium]CAH1679817.1 hypothetical protein CHELA41_24734 [Hyphomicrobiales bacterium]
MKRLTDLSEKRSGRALRPLPDKHGGPRGRAADTRWDLIAALYMRMSIALIRRSFQSFRLALRHYVFIRFQRI